MKSVKVRPASFDGTERPRAETTPVVTEPERPKGLPTATTVSPIMRSEDVPIGAAGGCFVANFTTGRALSGGTASSLAGDCEPSWEVTGVAEAPSATGVVVVSVACPDPHTSEPR